MALTHKTRDANRDPITKTPGAHPVGTGVGAAAGGTAGAAAGAAISGAIAGTATGGPIGTGVGLVAGAVAGGLAGKALSERIDPTVEDAYWRQNYQREPYFESGLSYQDYAPAYRTGYEGYARFGDRRFDEVECELESDYQRSRGASPLGWERAKAAARSAWDRVERALPGDADKDGR